MDRQKELGIARAYCYFSGTTKVADDKISEFSRAYEQLATIPISELRRIVANNIADVRDDVDPLVDTIQIFGTLPLTQPLVTFWKVASSRPLRVSEFEVMINEHPVLKERDKELLRKAVHTVYGEEEEKVSEAAEPEATYTQPPLPAIDQNPQDSKIYQEVLETLTEYMTKDVFASHLIPQITIESIKAVKNAYVVGLKFTSIDGSVSVYSDAVVMGKKLLPPTEIYDESGNKVGNFDKASFEQAFSASQSSAAAGTYNYQAMMDELLETATPVQAKQIIDTIIKRYGADAGKKAFDSYVSIRIGKKEPAKNVSPLQKLDVTEKGYKEESNEDK